MLWNIRNLIGVEMCIRSSFTDWDVDLILAFSSLWIGFTMTVVEVRCIVGAAGGEAEARCSELIGL